MTTYNSLKHFKEAAIAHMFFKIGVLKNFAMVTGKRLC